MGGKYSGKFTPVTPAKFSPHVILWRTLATLSAWPKLTK
jgi:hypothetical protein